ncbi:carbon-nitrogen hydrolase family protein [Moraxella sp. FZLJ2107]|uniref:carbon-nitrogen hydrolase family protein n=1 Tax=unclassified Moraxella TaxID=2685852 RepID=UPI0020C890AB|nr:MULTISPECIES: carbon-nitrogen hydrolase family protein [unclassified Moraxella]UTO06038.1 carbon-nitrogen hydrolase family protein [Moraxella sp. FZLJ2107]UTO22775.1 carbon-nitrogen hydrolase family protein [Moraxella sp. FZLJ2109]
MNTLKIASIQLNSQTDIDANLAIIASAVRDAAAHGARLIVLPENACVMGRQKDLAARFDKICEFYQALAKECSVHILAGTLPCPTRPNGQMVAHDKVRQVSLLIDDTGSVKARYDKIHLFRATVDDATGSYDEGKTFEAGDRLVVADCMIDGVAVGIGMMICFDVRFPALAQRLRQMGADIITVPAAFTFLTGQAHWQMLLQARALDSQCMVIGSAQGGTHHIGTSTRETWGHSLIINAHGQVIADTGSTDVDEHGYLVVYADFDPAKQAKIRQTMPIFDCHRLGA